ncbi:NAD(P)-binding protein [Diplogelasinospora grovesii]|uniref:NAD(P)-binding protein n=1 Tax=Diplogelasinospora grovesii TaxID=303347 RepID=A0AAN6NGW2_9PEZI|nr:NAD(P)-binding protein [Diplogelasinospora grovesii]
MPDQTLHGKVAIVTGANTGIGAAIARELASRGAIVVVNYPFPQLADQAKQVVDSLATASTSVCIEADLSTTTGPQKLVDETVRLYGWVDILVNNAGLAINKPFAEQTLDDWDKLVNLNARGVFLLTQAVLPHLPQPPSPKDTIEVPGEGEVKTERDYGRIVNIVSISARAAPPLQTIYAGTKGMVDSFTRVWAKELPRKYNCTVNAVSPGPTMTEGFAAAGEEFMTAMRPVMEQTPVGDRMARPEEIAFAVGFLCEPRASWINGLHLVASGGLFID